MRLYALALVVILAPNPLLSQKPEAAPNAKRIARKLASSELRWPKGVVPYVIEDGVADADNIGPAIEEWNSKTVIEFVPRRKQKSHVAFVSVEGGNCRARPRAGRRTTGNLHSAFGLFRRYVDPRDWACCRA